MPNRVVLTAMVVGLVMAAPTGGSAQSFLGRGWMGGPYLADKDRELLAPIIRDMLQNAKDGDTRGWSNPETRNHGDVRIVRSYTHDRMPCRDIRLNSVAPDGKGMTYNMPMCQVADGRWMMGDR